MSEVITYKCPNCTGPLKFDPITQVFRCEYCGSEFTEADIVSVESAKTSTVETSNTGDEVTDTTVATASEQPLEDSQVTPKATTLEIFTCPSCGAEVMTDETTAATFCYYCHNPVVLSGRVSGEFLPESVVPFSIDRQTAIDEFLKWAKSKKYVPKDFFNDEQIEKISGVYFPYWMINSDMDGEYLAKGTTIRVWRTGDIETTETKFYNISRKGNIKFGNMVKNALKRNSTVAMIESVQPFDTSKAKPFSSKYLAGFLADKRDVEYKDISEQVQKEFKTYGSSMIKNTVNGYTTVHQENINFPKFADKESYILLPVWLLTYRNKNTPEDEPFYYAMNGESGKVSGKLPIDKKRLGMSAFMLFAAIFALILIGGWFL